jgi:GT2 family glycosyltransferase
MKKANSRVPCISVIIVNWNGKHLLDQCLAALKKQTFRNFETIAVDNASTDGSVSFLKRHYPRVKIIQNEENVGFGRANNIGIAASCGKYVLLLNNDMVLDRNCIETLVKYAERCSNSVGGFSPLVIYSKNPQIIDSTGMIILKNGVGIDRSYHKKLSDEKNLPEEILGPCGMCPMFRRSALERIRHTDGNYFCSDIFMYIEDIDMVMRLRWAGFESRYVKDAYGFHHRSASVKSKSFKYSHTYANYQRFMLRNFTAKMFLLNIHMIAFVMAYRVISTIIKSGIKDMIIAQMQVIWEFHKHRQFNKKLVKNAAISDSDMVKLLAPHILLFEEFFHLFCKRD